MNVEPHHILLADDDNDDCLLFEEALKELPLPSHFAAVNDGEQLMQLLTKKNTRLPFALFLDLNLPRKNGIECLVEIRNTKRLKDINVVMYSTSAQLDLVNLLYKNGAQYYIRKPIEFTHLKKVIHQAIVLIAEKKTEQSSKENFVITGDL